MTDAELQAIEARAAAATQAHNRLMLHAGYMHDVSVAPVTDDDATVRASRQDVPALVTALRELRAAARAVIALDINTEWFANERTCRHCDQWLNHGQHDAGCPVGALAALVGEGQDG